MGRRMINHNYSERVLFVSLLLCQLEQQRTVAIGYGMLLDVVILKIVFIKWNSSVY